MLAYFFLEWFESNDGIDELTRLKLIISEKSLTIVLTVLLTIMQYLMLFIFLRFGKPLEDNDKKLFYNNFLAMKT